jgi:hypothetical protein
VGHGTIGEYNVITLHEYKPTDYMAAIKEAEEHGMEVVIIDSITHEWKYILEAVDKLSGGGKNYTAWGKASPMHDMFIQAILKSDTHIITTVRSKQDYDMNKDDKTGKTTVTKVGMKPETREGFEYELIVSFDIDIKHNALVSKDRTGKFVEKYGDMPFQITEETGQIIKAWHDSAAEVAPVVVDEPKKENTIVTLDTPASAPPLKVNDRPLPPIPDKVQDPDEKIKPAAIMAIKKAWGILYELGVQLGKHSPKDEKKKFLATINDLPPMKGREVQEYHQLTFQDGEGILKKINEWIPIVRKQVKEYYEKLEAEKKASEEAQNTAEVAQEIFGGDDIEDAPLIPEETIPPEPTRVIKKTK